MGRNPTIFGLDNRTNAETEDLITPYITTMYYAALANLYIQSAMPDGTPFDEAPRMKTALNRTSADFRVAAQWLAGQDDKRIDASPAKEYYQEATALDASLIKNSNT